MALVKCPCAFRLRRLFPGLGSVFLLNILIFLLLNINILIFLLLNINILIFLSSSPSHHLPPIISL